MDMKIKLEPINDTNREAVLALTVREDQLFVAPNDYSLSEADEANAKAPGTARPFAIYAGEKIVGFCMLALDPEDENPVDRYCLWRFMIDKNEQGKGYGQAALHEIIKYFKENGVDRIYLSTAPENELGLHVYHKAGFRETGEMEDEDEPGEEEEEIQRITELIEKLREDARANAEQSVRVQAAIEQIVELEQLEATEEEMGQAIAMVARQNRMTVEELKPYCDAAFQAALTRSVLTGKVMGLIREWADVTVTEE